MKTIIRTFVAAVALLAASTGADAGLFRAYLSVAGNDGNACTVGAPCRLLPAALAAVNDGGEIWMMDSGNFNVAPVTIDKSVSILAIPGALGSLVAVGGPALNIAGSSIVVSLLNLQVLNFSAGTTGIVFSGGSQLTLDGCEIYGLPQNGIDVIAPTALFVVKNSVFRDNGGNGITVSQAAGATLDRVQVLGNQLGVALGTVPHSTITDSVFAGNVSGGIILENTDGSSTQLVLERSVVRGSANGVLLNSVISGSRTMVNAKRNTVSDNAGSGFFLGSNDGAFATVTLDRNVVSGNGTGVLMVGIGTNIAQSPVTNTFTFNGVDANPGPFLTGFAQQ